MSSTGKAIDPVPILSLLLEPRSVIITSGTLYKDHLHCIQELTEDVVEGSRTASDNPDAEDETADSNPPPQRGQRGMGSGVRVDNWDQLRDPSLRQVAIDGGVLQRGTRISLTCRDVEKVRKIGLMGSAKR
jgi:alkylated DNA repair protein alkB family protein 6